MTNTSEKEEVKIEVSEKRKFFEEEGSLFLGMAPISIVSIFLIPLLGITIPKDIQILYDLFKTMKVKPVGKIFCDLYESSLQL